MTWPLHACCSISEVILKTQCRKPAMRNVTRWCLPVLVTFPITKKTGSVLRLTKRLTEARIKSRLFFHLPCCTLLIWKTGSRMGIELLSSYLLPSGDSKLKRKIVSRCTHLLCPFFMSTTFLHLHPLHLHTVAKGVPVLHNSTFFLFSLS